MGNRLKLIVLGLAAVFFASCDDTTFQRSVPAYPVHAEINTKTEFVDFLPTNTNAYITVNELGYFKNGQFVKVTSVLDRWGYGGIVVYVSLGGYVAFDLGCPYCAAHGIKSPCEMDGISAVCPICGEEYELALGYATPQKGISKETLRPLNCMPQGDKLVISQRP